MTNSPRGIDAEEDTTPAWEVEFIEQFTYRTKKGETGLYDRSVEKALDFIRKTRTEAVKETVDYIYANLPFTTDRREMIVMDKKELSRVLEQAKEV